MLFLWNVDDWCPSWAELDHTRTSNTYLAMLGMVTTQRNELLADWATSIRFPLADLRMLNHTFHLLAAW
jgi:hypothetical protein